MIIINSYIVPIYIFTLILFVNCNCSYMFWLMMELNMVTFILLIYYLTLDSSNQDCSSLCLYYFLIQCFTSIMFLFSLCNMEMMNFNFQFLLLSLSLIFKLGLFPFYFWVYRISKYLSILILFFILVIQKIPLFLFSFSLFDNIMNLSFFSSLILGSFFLIISCNIKDFLISSSIYSVLWIYLLYINSMFSFFIYIFLYLLLIFFFSSYLNNYSFESLNSINLLYVFMFFMFSVGLPPFSLFFFKFFLNFYFVLFFSYLEFFAIWFFSFVSILGYIKLLYGHFFFVSSFYLKYDFNFDKMFMLLGTFLFFLFFFT